MRKIYFDLQCFNDEYGQVILSHLVMRNEGNDNIGNTLKGVTIQALGGNDTIGV